MNIYQKFEQIGFPASAAVYENGFDLMGYEAIRESASLRNWLWDCHSIWVVVRHSLKFGWVIETPAMHFDSNGEKYSTPQQAYLDAFQAVLNAHDFIQHQYNKQL